MFSTESVTPGHPDKVADQIADAILDAHLMQDPHARVACEVMVSRQFVLLAGEITSKADVDYDAVVRKTVELIGYGPGVVEGFESSGLVIENKIQSQSPGIAHNLRDGGAGDQGIMFGYAINSQDTNYLPYGYWLSQRLSRHLTLLQGNYGQGRIVYPDGKLQITLTEPFGREIDTLLVSVHCTPGCARFIGEGLLVDERGTKTFLFNPPDGNFLVGGPACDTGLTGRKIVQDTYGAYAPHGGGAFSGKDATKVDRSGAYAARWIAKSLVVAGLTNEVTVQLAYAFGVAEPVSVYTGDSKLDAIIKDNFDLRPRAIIEELGLDKPIYNKTARNGHFTDPTFPWEKPKAL